MLSGLVESMDYVNREGVGRKGVAQSRGARAKSRQQKTIAIAARVPLGVLPFPAGRLDRTERGDRENWDAALVIPASQANPF